MGGFIYLLFKAAARLETVVSVRYLSSAHRAVTGREIDSILVSSTKIYTAHKKRFRQRVDAQDS